MTYRAGTKTDAEQIAKLHAESWRRTYRGILLDDFLDGDVLENRLQVWRGRLRVQRDDQFVCVAVGSDSRVAGFVCAYGNKDPEWGSLIDNLHVSAGAQGNGIGSTLMAHAAAWLQSCYAGFGVYLWVMEANHAARRFYERRDAANAGTVEKENPGGGTARRCRYVWPEPSMIVPNSGQGATAPR